MVKASSSSGRVNAISQTTARPMYTPTLTYSRTRNLYVATDGSDSNSGASIHQPTYQTINVATTRAAGHLH